MAKLSGMQGFDKIKKVYDPEGLTDEDFNLKKRIETEAENISAIAKVESVKPKNDKTKKPQASRVVDMPHVQSDGKLKRVYTRLTPEFENAFWQWCIKKEITKAKALRNALASAVGYKQDKVCVELGEIENTAERTRIVYVEVPTELKLEIKIEARNRGMSEDELACAILKSLLASAK